MSVIEPVTQGDLKTWSSLPSGKNMDDALLTYNADEDQKQVSEGLKEKASVKKRKSRKSGDGSGSHKKVKGVAHANNEAIPSQA